MLADLGWTGPTDYDENLQFRFLAIPVAPKPLPSFRESGSSLKNLTMLHSRALSSLTAATELNHTDPRISKDHHRKGGRVGYGARLRSA
ncbi:hypothetical protein CCUS01_00879 [Colletotrichum cuscutae]|uniref:Uncharacterized protein n=1 Tax=Colletotrichum cuscutae TaxID=1209917 RepID=A0AAI9V4R3_9PEZI|nr:hypothetical protein CCUS01_00879 [Colletotrichum cuscutae]